MTAAAFPEPDPAPPAPTTAVLGALKTPTSWFRDRPVLAAQLRGFALVAVVCTVISMAIFTCLRPLLGIQWANAISLVLCSVLNTELNRRTSFGLKSSHLWWRDHRRGLWVMFLALAITTGSLWLLHQVAPEAALVTVLSVIVLGNVTSAIVRFLLLRYWIFRRVRHLVPHREDVVPDELHNQQPR